MEWEAYWMVRTPRRRSAWAAAAAVLAMVAVGAWLVATRNGEERGGPSGPNTAPATAAPTTATTVTAAEASAIWPFPGKPAYATPREAAGSFATEYLGFVDPVIGAFQQGDLRSGEVPVRPRADGPVTTILVRQLTGPGWWVIGAATDDIEVTEPEVLAEVRSPLRVRGRALAFEGTVAVEVRQDGDVTPIGSGIVTGGGDVPRPFEGSIAFAPPRARYGALVLRTHSAEDGRVWQAGAIRIAFGSGDGREGAWQRPPTRRG